MIGNLWLLISHMQHSLLHISKEHVMTNILNERVVEAFTMITVAISGFLALLVFSAA